jgi:signal transduction protein with GAF and PtsI domain
MTACRHLATWLQLIGNIITLGGLVYAWHILTGRLSRWRDEIGERLTELRAVVASKGTGVTQQVGATLTVEPIIEAVLELIRDGSDEERIKRVEQNYDNLANQVRELTETFRTEIDQAIAAELETFQANTNAIRLTDITYAALGILVSISGYICQLIG